MPRFGDSGVSKGSAESERNIKRAYVGGATVAGAGVAGAGYAIRNAGQRSAAHNERELMRFRNDRTFARMAVDRHLAEAAGHRAKHRKGAAAAEALAAEKKALDRPLKLKALEAKSRMASGQKWAGRGKGMMIGAAGIPLAAIVTRNRVARDWKANPQPERPSSGSKLRRDKVKVDRGGLSVAEHERAAAGAWDAPKKGKDVRSLAEVARGVKLTPEQIAERRRNGL